MSCEHAGDALTGLQTGDSAIGADAFSIGGTTVDPTLVGGGEGFTPVEQLVGAPPLLDLGGGTLTIFGVTLSLASQNFNVYDGAELPTDGSVYDVLNLGGLENVYTAIPGLDGAAGAARLLVVWAVWCFGSLRQEALSYSCSDTPETFRNTQCEKWIEDVFAESGEF